MYAVMRDPTGLQSSAFSHSDSKFPFKLMVDDKRAPNEHNGNLKM